MYDNQREQCNVLFQDILKLHNLNKPVYCGMTDRSEIPIKNIPNWEVLPIHKAARVKSILFEGSIDEDAVKKEVSRMKNEHRVVQVANIIINKQFELSSPYKEYKKQISATLVKFQMGECTNKANIKPGGHNPWVRFGISYERDLSDLRMIKGIGSPIEVVLLDNELYFIDYSYRSRDDTFQHIIDPEQQAIYLRDIYQGIKGESFNLSTLCRVLYWEDGQVRFE